MSAGRYSVRAPEYDRFEMPPSAQTRSHCLCAHQYEPPGLHREEMGTHTHAQVEQAAHITQSISSQHVTFVHNELWSIGYRVDLFVN